MRPEIMSQIIEIRKWANGFYTQHIHLYHELGVKSGVNFTLIHGYTEPVQKKYNHLVDPLSFFRKANNVRNVPRNHITFIYFHFIQN